MIIRKITEVTETQTTESFQLICHEKDEGWELTREEMEKLRAMTERSLEDFYGRREKETVPAELYDDLYRKYTLACYQLEDKYRPEECPDFIEPPESTEIVENVQKEAENEPKQAQKVQKEGKKAQKKVVRDFSKYIKMANNECSRRMILDAMIKDFGVEESTAVTYYHTKIRTKPVPQKMMVKDPTLKEEIAALPDYGSYTDFKDALAKADVGRGRYTVKALKTMYLETHQHIKW